MDAVDLRRLMISVVGFSMAAAGLFLSIAAPVVATIVPYFQSQMPVLVDVHSQKRETTVPRKSSRIIDTATASTLSRSEDSVVTSSTGTTSSAIPSAANDGVGQAPMVTPKILQDLPTTAQFNASPSSPPGCATHVRHICSPQHCANQASTSASPSPSLELINERARSKNRNSLPSGFCIRASPTPSFLSLTPITPDEPAVNSPRACSSSESHATHEGVRPSRRSTSFFGLRRTSKRSLTSTRSGSEPASQPSIPPPSRRNSMTSSPARILASLRDHTSLDSAAAGPEGASRSEEKTKGSSYFFRLKNKKIGKDKEKDKSTSKENKSRQKENISEGEQDGCHSQPHSEAEERPSRRPICPRSRSARRSDTAPAPRTRPYEAPYNFPAPNSPEAIDYVRRTRDEYMRLSSSPPAVGAPLPDPPVRTSVSTPPLTRIPQSAPADHIGFVPPERHRKTASAGADELGFILRPTPPPTERLHVHYGVARASTLPAGVRAAPPADAQSPPRPILKRSGLSL
ncbi:hypothetical protein M0805_003194 [Coniferiporia weirii]|nr:hypothetical protein M0805_003194 [Coniferiporia weirii]